MHSSVTTSPCPVAWKVSMKCLLSLPCLVCVLLVPAAKAVTIEMVTVGNPGNAPDTRYNSHRLRLGGPRLPDRQVRGHGRPVHRVSQRRGQGRPQRALQHEHGDPSEQRRQHRANRFFPQLQLQRGRRLGRPAGEQCELLGRGPVCQLAPQRPAHRAAGSRNDRGRRVSQCRQRHAVRTQRRRTVLHPQCERVVQGGLSR